MSVSALPVTHPTAKAERGWACLTEIVPCTLEAFPQLGWQRLMLDVRAHVHDQAVQRQCEVA